MEKSDLQAVAVIAGLTMTSPWSEEQFRQELKVQESIRLVAKRDEVIAGFVVIRRMESESELLYLAVTPDLRRQGVASFLLLEGMARLKVYSVAKCYLEVRSSNDGAIEFYKKHDFQRIGQRPGYYNSPKEDAFIMCKKIVNT